MRAVASVVLALTVGAACSVDRSGLAQLDGIDGGEPPRDSFVRMPDLGGDLGSDLGTPPDAFQSIDLGVDAPPLMCMPLCSFDGASAMECSTAGMLISTHCDRGCDPGTSNCRPSVDCPYLTIATIVTGTMHFDLCGAGADHDFTPAPGCGTSADGEDVVVRLEVDTPGSYRLEVADSGGDYHVDPVVYVDTACDDGATQLGCDDDSGSGTDSQLDLMLDAGEYFVFVDSIDNETFGDGCSPVDLTVTRM